jgi:hypothetical protein
MRYKSGSELTGLENPDSDLKSEFKMRAQDSKNSSKLRKHRKLLFCSAVCFFEICRLLLGAFTKALGFQLNFSTKDTQVCIQLSSKPGS